VLVRVAGEIKYGGAPGAFDKEFISMESKLEEVKNILAGSNISLESLEELQAKLRQIRHVTTPVIVDNDKFFWLPGELMIMMSGK
jgi:hypothetical protein